MLRLRPSSGTQELLPLLNVIERLATQPGTSKGSFSRFSLRTCADRVPPARHLQIGERRRAQANVFPSTQNELVRLFAWLSNPQYWAFNWAISTHSPYILSSFNNLIMAGQLASERPELKDEIANLVPTSIGLATVIFGLTAFTMECSGLSFQKVA